MKRISKNILTTGTTLAVMLTLSLSALAEPKITRITVYPDAVNLNTLRDAQSLVVQATFDNGLTRDVTRQAKYTFADNSLVKFDRDVVHPAKDGKTELTVEYGGQSVKLPVTVKDAQKERPISFRLDVMPVFAKAGCNSGACHGAARGKDGFHLSLFGYDPAGDYHNITRQMSGRRINLALPAESLLVTKSLGTVQHTGGDLFSAQSPYYATLMRWLEAGAPDDSKDVARPVGIELLPHKMVLDGKGESQQMTVIAHYSDGTDRDVTNLAVFITNNDRSADIDTHGRVTAGHRGEAFLMARFAEFTEGSDAIVLPKGLNYEWPNALENNYVDKLIHDKLKKLRVTPSKICSDEVFIRRASLDITGTLPTREQFDKFIADKSPDKREKLVDELLNRKEFVEMWVMKFAELLQIRSNGNVAQGISYKAAVLYYNWLQEQIANDVPMDKIVRQLLGASGGTFSNPPSNFYQIERDNKKLSENVAQVFMGMRLQCAQCHNHPFDRWTMDDYYGFVSFFTQVGRKGAEDPREQIIFDSNKGDARHPVGNRVMKPKFLGGAVPEITGDQDRRKVLADWLASPENPYFARNLANIVWAHFFGRGIVDPVDDVRVSNPASNPELLAELAKRFTEYNYDFKKLVRDICTSRTYQLSTQTNATNESDGTNFSHAYVRRIRAEVLFDAISQVTETEKDNKFKGLPRGARAVQIADGNTSTYFLETFGRASRETVCSCEVKMEPNLSQALHLLNGDTVNRKIVSGKVIETLLKDGKTPQQIIDDLFIRCFSRKPTETESQRLAAALKDEKNPADVLHDVFWAMLNSKEFIFNH
ncbi:DUF1553 domain-containing protein [Planctomycetales bacterium ZRK34]|nr:DUF1553 domain-containing protein [Planctomycetales bacterium ZRK34]